MRSLALCLLAVTACSSASPPAVARAIELRALTPRGEALAGVRAWRDGASLGETASDGALRATLRGSLHQRVVLSWACPAAYEPTSAQRELVLEAEPAAGARAPLKLEARCTPLDIEAALVVRASGAPASGLPVVVRDEVVARTDAGGLAHVLLRARRGSALTVALDTSEHPKLVPASPLETFQLGSADAILLFDRTLATVSAPKSKSAHGSKAKEPEIHKPIRIQ